MIVYKITNNVNNKVYIGITSKTLHERWLQHVNAALSSRSHYPFHKAIRKYKPNSFTLEILEEVETEEEAKQREQYWISFYNSYVKFNLGYNATLGGDNNQHLAGEESPSAKLTQKQVDDIIKELLYGDLQFLEIVQKYHLPISDREISAINSGESWFNSKYNYPIRNNPRSFAKKGVKNPKSKLTESQVLKIIELLKFSNLPQTKIAQQFGVSYNTINFINRCKTWTHLHNYTDFIRQK